MGEQKMSEDMYQKELCPSSIYGLCLPLWYLQTFVITSLIPT